MRMRRRRRWWVWLGLLLASYTIQIVWKQYLRTTHSLLVFVFASIVVLEFPLLLVSARITALHDYLLLGVVDGQTLVGRSVVQLLRCRIELPELNIKINYNYQSLYIVRYIVRWVLRRYTWLPLDPWHGYRITSTPEKSRQASSRRISPVLLNIQYCKNTHLSGAKKKH